MPRKTVDLNKFLSEELIAKYEFFAKNDFPTVSNMSVDSFFPKIFNQKILKKTIRSADLLFNTSSFAISEFVANTFEVRKAHISELCDVLGYTEPQIKRILLDVKRKDLSIFLVGFGGTGTNFNYWMQELCNWTNTVNIFDTIHVNDTDSFTLSNIVRIPFDYRTQYKRETKRYLFNNSAHICKKISILSSSTSAVLYGTQSPQSVAHLIFYGAPDINTRKELSESNAKFVSATHSDDECQLYLNPPQDGDIQMETYGKINLSVFFMNHLKMTLDFLEFLQKSENINWNQSGEISTYDFKKTYNKSIDDEEPMGSGRLYRFPCMTKEESEANTARNNAELQSEVVQDTEPTMPDMPDMPMPMEPIPRVNVDWGDTIDLSSVPAGISAEEFRRNNQVEDHSQNDGLQTPLSTIPEWEDLSDDVLDQIISGEIDSVEQIPTEEGV